MVLFLIFLLLSSPAKADNVYIYKVTKVIDGDTFEIETENQSLLIQELGLKIRVSGIDTPEMKGKCNKEKELAQKAKKIASILILNKDVKLSNVKWDKFGGRIDATVEIGDINLAQTLINNKLAVEYNGEKKSKNWCK